MKSVWLVFRLSWRNLWRQPRRSLLTASAIAVGLALCMSTLALQDGMFDEMYEILVRRQIGDIQVHHERYPQHRVLQDTIPQLEEVEHAIGQVRGVEASSTRVLGYALLGYENEAIGGQLIGIRPSDENAITKFQDAALTQFPDDTLQSGEIWLGAHLAKRLHAHLQREIIVVTQAANGAISSQIFVVTGLIKLGSTFDRTQAYITLADAQALFGLSGGAHEIAIVLRERESIDTIMSSLRALNERGFLSIQPWFQINPTAAKLIGLRETAAWLIAAIVFGVAALGVLNTMLMAVLERTRELGVLSALGMRPLEISALILTEALWMSIVGSCLGLVLGGALDLYLVVYGIDFGKGTELSFGGVTFDPILHGAIHLSNVFIPLWVVLLTSILASIWPAVRAATLEPIEAIFKH